MTVVYPPKPFRDGEPAGADADVPLTVPPGVKFTARERRIWAYLVARMQADGLAPPTIGLAVSVVVRTYSQWLEAEAKLAEVMKAHDGSYFVVSGKGYEQPHQAWYASRNLRIELRKWLPECCLTLPSRARVQTMSPDAGPADDLFDALAGHAARHPGWSGG